MRSSSRSAAPIDTGTRAPHATRAQGIAGDDTIQEMAGSAYDRPDGPRPAGLSARGRSAMTRTLTVLVLGVLLGVGATLLLAPVRACAAGAYRDAAAHRLRDGARAECRRTGCRREAAATSIASSPTPMRAELASMIAQAAARTAVDGPRARAGRAVETLCRARCAARRAPRARGARRRCGARLPSMALGRARRRGKSLAALSTVENPDDAADVALALIRRSATTPLPSARRCRARGARGRNAGDGHRGAVRPVISPTGPSAWSRRGQRWR